MLISDAYREQNRLLHESKPAFGSKGGKEWPQIQALCQKEGYRTILDYGAGKNGIKNFLKPPIEVYEYEPAFDVDERRPCDLVYSRDVLEHIEPELLPEVLDDLRANMLRRGWFLIATVPSGDILPDGRNAHLIVKPIDWWIAQLEEAGMKLADSHSDRKRGLVQVVPI